MKLEFICATLLCWFALPVFCTKQIIEDESFLIPPHTVKSLDLDAYLGRWYQMYASKNPNQTYERDGYCITGDYFPVSLKGAAFALTNSMRVSSPTGNLQQANGLASKTGDPGKFTVTFDNVPAIGFYWVVAVGDILPESNQYPWSVVSTPFAMDLFILARDPNTFRTEYQDEVLDLVNTKGFTKEYNSPLETYQADDCEYAPFPR